MMQGTTIDELRAEHIKHHVGFVWECLCCGEKWKEAKQIGEKMHTAMLWFDNSHDSIEKKIQKAVDYYDKKYGRKPDLCLLHPSTLTASEPKIEGLTVRAYRPVLPGHIWIGIEDKE
jgi:hypothetical protein